MKCGSCKICMTQKNFEYHAQDCETIARWRKAVDDTMIIEEL